MGKAGSEHKRPIQWVGVGEGLSSLRPPETNGGFWCSALALVRSKYLYTPVYYLRGVIFDRNGVAGGDTAKGNIPRSRRNPVAIQGSVRVGGKVACMKGLF